MRKLSLYIIAAGATLGVSLAQADDIIDAGSTTDVPELMVDPGPAVQDTSGETIDPSLVVDDIVMDPVDEVVELTGDGGDPAVEVINTDEAKSDDTAGTDDSGAVDDTAGTDDSGAADDTGATEDGGVADDTDTTDDTLDPMIYATSGGTVDSRPEDCMQCRNLTGESAGEAVEAAAPEVMVDVLDGNATGVDVMDPIEGKKRRSH